MDFKQQNEHPITKKLGYAISYFVFTTILYLVLLYLKKLPEAWTYFHIMAITALIALAGESLKKWLK